VRAARERPRLGDKAPKWRHAPKTMFTPASAEDYARMGVESRHLYNQDKAVWETWIAAGGDPREFK
jgi:hypothetical protein